MSDGNVKFRQYEAEGLIFGEPQDVKIVDVDGNEYVKIVRCKDCKYGKGHKLNYRHCSLHDCEIRNDGFCADGERRCEDAK